MFHVKVSPITKIISLSGFLALGFLLVILSCALFRNYYPLFDILIFLIAPLPNLLSRKSDSFGSNGSTDFMSESNNSNHDFAHFMTGLFVSSGILMPMIFQHCQIITPESCAMSVLGGSIIYASIVVFTRFFNSSWDQEDDALFG
ncbi:hypothetical protein TBLA_0C01700 [Henningerozyma blattae CBS 6284]|uniref:Vacuolar protein sorting-associated protein 55 n=1 Tax=Henningerozyma blattae (strain ATCC 34711 / CBS 6284 / DSM 70876 / NBRC 10599 / NRRL Y-10934 / UCD 77-7) TaxID=1071380 RepID=I2H0T2_HENB6|nr:hypothetical protein TBLA_0C01700 [Tetrapisispora blattae CBS 6284]CCH59984.1 hypothetical protein TBLA_0C01700 [Tetrapisispora blattae CBS 6284]